ncbi:hypothetical protein SLS62_007448 [Diatrype stigma]|uniref:Uncharacterized protein n=1 Tax=Diatrype stigma TaxID=117547 RepID=A0AAN9UP70_9PEZI
MSNESVGSLLAVIAHSLNDALRILMFADKRAWGPDEFEQLRLLEETLDEAKKDFQELPALVNGRFYYEHDRKSDSLHELRNLCARFSLHSQNFKDWLRQGGPINPVWAVETITLRGELHRAQCHAAQRVYDAERATTTRCLGALQVYRVQRPPELVATQQQQQQSHRPQDSQDHYQLPRPRHLEELAACNKTGNFERFGDYDIAFVCDFCDGYLVWEDLREMPSIRSGALPPGGDSREPLSTFNNPRHGARKMAGPTVSPGTKTATATTTDTERTSYSRTSSDDSNTSNGTATTTTAAEAAAVPTTTTTTPLLEVAAAEEAAAAPDQWQATGFARTDGAEKTVVFAPVAIANHLSPAPGEWHARILCPFCDEYYYEEPGDDEVERIRYAQDEGGFESIAAFQEHLGWYHTSLVQSLPSSAAKCAVM